MKDHREAWLVIGLLALAGCSGSTSLTGDAAGEGDAMVDAAGDTRAEDAGDARADVPGETTDDGAADAAGDATDDGTGDADALPNCPGYSRPYAYPPGTGADCRSDADCPAGIMFCLLPGVVICGICPPPTATCATDLDCPPGDICLTVPPPCPYCPGPSTMCVPRCTADSCGLGATCNTTTGRCNPVRCGAHWACPLDMRCGGSGGDEHGCVRLSCTVDGDCDCGVCASGTCIDGPGVCSGPAA